MLSCARLIWQSGLLFGFHHNGCSWKSALEIALMVNNKVMVYYLLYKILFHIIESILVFRGISACPFFGILGNCLSCIHIVYYFVRFLLLLSRDAHVSAVLSPPFNHLIVYV